MHNFSYWEQKYFWKTWDFTIVGSGITGLTIAYFIKQKYPNANICVLERSFLPTGASTKNAGFACFGSVTEILDDLKGNNAQNVFSLLHKRYLGLDSLRSILGDSNIGFNPCGGFEVFTSADSENFEECQENLTSINNQLTHLLGKNVFANVPPGSNDFGFSGFDHILYNRLEGSIDTGLMMQSLIHKVRSIGIEIFNGIDVDKIDFKDANPTIHSNIGSFQSKQVIIATNGFANKLLPKLDVKPGRAQVLITEPISNLKLSGTFHHNKGYNYFRNIDNRILLGGGRDLNKNAEETVELGETAEVQSYLESLLRNHILPGQKVEIAHRWSGIMGVGNSKEVILESVGPSTICAVRFGGMGVALGAYIGKEVAKMV